MKVILSMIAVGLLGCSLVAAGIYAWHGQWAPVAFALVALVAGKLALGLVELLLTPIALPLIYFARRGNTLISSLFAMVFAFAGKAASAAYCAIVLLFYLRHPGPPTWLVVALAMTVASAPFAWASARSDDDTHPVHFDHLLAEIGVAISGAMLVSGFAVAFALLPIALAFLVSAAGFVIWWIAKGAPQARLEYFMGQRWP